MKARDLALVKESYSKVRVLKDSKGYFCWRLFCQLSCFMLLYVHAVGVRSRHYWTLFLWRFCYWFSLCRRLWWCYKHLKQKIKEFSFVVITKWRQQSETEQNKTTNSNRQVVANNDPDKISNRQSQCQLPAQTTPDQLQAASETPTQTPRNPASPSNPAPPLVLRKPRSL